jgi:hypothetical protein
MGGVMKEVEIREGKTDYKPLKTVKKTLETAVYGLFTFSLVHFAITFPGK